MYAPLWWPVIPPEMLQRASLLQAKLAALDMI